MSPVVATLILILIAVAAAAALYLWLVAWQGGVTAGIGSPGAQATLTIGGSTSVYPFSQVAVTQFEQNNSDVVISNNQGGTGAGMAAVCSGQVNIGAASSPQTATTLQTSDGCPATVAIEVVAYDGVDAMVPTANPHGLQSISWDTLQAIYVAASTTPASSGITNLHNTQATFTFGAGAARGAMVPIAATTAPLGFAWDQIPALAQAANGTVIGAYTFGFALSVSAGTTPPGTEVACGIAPYTNDLCSPTADATTCGWTICAGGSGTALATDIIHTEARSEVSGTTQSFIARLLAVGASGTTPSGIGFTGCSGDNQFDGCGMTMPNTAAGNPNVIAAVAANPDGIGYASDGLVQTSGSGVVPVNFQGFAQTTVVNIQGESTALKAIASGTSGSYGAQSYVGWRPFSYVETAPPTGEALRYLQFVMDPANNVNFAAQSAEISIYASGLAGVVPITPIP